MFSTEIYYQYIDLCIMFIKENIRMETENLNLDMYNNIKSFIKHVKINQLKDFIKSYLHINNINDITEIQILYEKEEGHVNYIDEHHYYYSMTAYVIYNKLYESHYYYFKDILDECIRDHEEDMRISYLLEKKWEEEFDENNDDDENNEDDKNEFLKRNDDDENLWCSHYAKYQITKLDYVFNNLNTMP